MDLEEVLAGGNVSPHVVKVGFTVRKPSTLSTPAIQAFLTYLNSAGFQAAPRCLGLDEQSRQILEYIPGIRASDGALMTVSELNRIGSIIRQLHDVSINYRSSPSDHWDVVTVPDNEELICHNDLAPWNLIRDGQRWVFIDWDNTAPGSRLWDLAYAAVTFLPIEPDCDLRQAAVRLDAIATGYRLSEHDCKRLPELMARRARAMYDLLVEGSKTGEQPWARLYAEGHGQYWGPVASYLETHLSFLSNALISAIRSHAAH